MFDTWKLFKEKEKLENDEKKKLLLKKRKL